MGDGRDCDRGGAGTLPQSDLTVPRLCPRDRLSPQAGGKETWWPHSGLSFVWAQIFHWPQIRVFRAGLFAKSQMLRSAFLEDGVTAGRREGLGHRPPRVAGSLPPWEWPCGACLCRAALMTAGAVNTAAGAAQSRSRPRCARPGWGLVRWAAGLQPGSGRGEDDGGPQAAGRACQPQRDPPCSPAPTRGRGGGWRAGPSGELTPSPVLGKPLPLMVRAGRGSSLAVCRADPLRPRGSRALWSPGRPSPAPLSTHRAGARAASGLGQSSQTQWAGQMFASSWRGTHCSQLSPGMEPRTPPPSRAALPTGRGLLQGRPLCLCVHEPHAG